MQLKNIGTSILSIALGRAGRKMNQEKSQQSGSVGWCEEGVCLVVCCCLLFLLDRL